MKPHPIAGGLLILALITMPAFTAADTSLNFESQRMISLLSTIVQLQERLIATLTVQITQLEQLLSKTSGREGRAPMDPPDLALRATYVLTASPSSGIAPLRVSFWANGGPYVIDFGDGTSKLNCAAEGRGDCSVLTNSEGTSTFANHTYMENGTYVATIYTDDLKALASTRVIVGGH